MRIDQLTAGFAKGDAISDMAVAMQKLFRRWGCESEIYAIPQFTDPRARGLCTDYREYAALGGGDPEDVLIFHFSVGGELVAFFASLQCRKVLLYHNITPPKYYAAMDAGAARRLEEGYARLESLRESVDLVIAGSEFNKAGLMAAGYRNVEVVPPLIDFQSLDVEPDPDVLRRHSDMSIKILFVGRLVPNKKFEDLIKIFYFYQKTVNPKSRLYLVGAHPATGRYSSYLRGLVKELDLMADVRDVLFTGHIDLRELVAYYRLADVFLCMSEHEGFCIPLLEAMYFEIPVIAYRSSAVPETLGGASILVNRKEPELIAEMIQEVVSNRALRETIIQRQNRRLADFRPEVVSQRLRGCLGPWLDN